MLLRNNFNLLRQFQQLTKCMCYRNQSKSVKDLLENATVSDPNDKAEVTQWSTMPYPEGAFLRRDQAGKVRRPKTDPRETSIMLFPGQGAQYVGMAKDLVQIPEARDMFELASDVLGYDLLKLCLEGPKSKLDKTIYCQPAVMVTSLACLEKLKEERPNAIANCVATAGFSLGEITALVFAGALPFDRAVKLVQIRAQAMQLASDENQGGMATVLYGPDSELGLACKRAKEWAMEKGEATPECQVANYLYPHCKVVAGSSEALKFLEANAKQYKLRRIRRLPVSGAFHTLLMQPAVEVFKKALKKIRIEMPAINVHSNVDGKCYTSPSHILNNLPKQIVRPVKWEQLLHIVYERSDEEHFPRTFECGPGKGLTTILKQVNAKAWDSAINIEA